MLKVLRQDLEKIQKYPFKYLSPLAKLIPTNWPARLRPRRINLEGVFKDR